MKQKQKHNLKKINKKKTPCLETTLHSPFLFWKPYPIKLPPTPNHPCPFPFRTRPPGDPVTPLPNKFNHIKVRLQLSRDFMFNLQGHNLVG